MTPPEMLAPPKLPPTYCTSVPDERTGGQCRRLFNIIFPGGFRRGTPARSPTAAPGKLRAINPWLLRPCRGEVPERPNGRDWKSRRGYRLSRVQIPPSPPGVSPQPALATPIDVCLPLPIHRRGVGLSMRFPGARRTPGCGGCSGAKEGVRGCRLPGWRIAPAVCLRCRRSSSGRPAGTWTCAIR